METKQTVMIVDTDRKRVKALRRILRECSTDVNVEECNKVSSARDSIVSCRPDLVLLHSAFPYMEEDGTGLLELIHDDFRNSKTGLMLVLPISGSLLYRSGYQEGSEIIEMADDLITTDFTSDMIQSVVSDYLDRRVAAETVTESVEAGEYAFVPTKQV